MGGEKTGPWATPSPAAPQVEALIDRYGSTAGAKQ